MDMMMIILGLSGAMWLIIDWLKDNIGWSKLKHGNLITMVISAAAAFILAFQFQLDLIFAMNWATEITIAGIVMTAFAMMGGSSLINKIAGLLTVKKEEASVTTNETK